MSSSTSSDTDTDTSSDTSDDDDSSITSSSASSSSLSTSSSESSKAHQPLPPAQSKHTTKPSTKPSSKSLSRALIFTKSTESAHRLGRLLALLDPSLTPLIDTFTRSPSEANKKTARNDLNRSRAKVLQAFNHGTTRLLICTDLAARGLDIPALEHVINYDVPASALTYVHRVGRTARAGLAGNAWTLVEHKQGKWFWETIGGKTGKSTVMRGDRSIHKLNLAIDAEGWAESYEAALAKLGQDVRA